MYHMVLLVLDDVDLCGPVLDGWEAAGTSGITLLGSTGLGRLRKAALRDDLPLLPNIASLLRGREEQHRTLFTVVEDEAMVDRLIAATQKVTGDLAEPDRGVLFVLPVSRVVGLRRSEG
jgi:nitrogen regulatory protein P-II 1